MFTCFAVKLFLSGVIIFPTKENISSLGTLEPGVIKTIRDTSKTKTLNFFRIHF